MLVTTMSATESGNPQKVTSTGSRGVASASGRRTAIRLTAGQANAPFSPPPGRHRLNGPVSSWAVTRAFNEVTTSATASPDTAPELATLDNPHGHLISP